MIIIETEHQLKQLKGTITSWRSWDHFGFSKTPMIEFTVAGQVYLIFISIHNFIKGINNDFKSLFKIITQTFLPY